MPPMRGRPRGRPRGLISEPSQPPVTEENEGLSMWQILAENKKRMLERKAREAEQGSKSSVSFSQAETSSVTAPEAPTDVLMMIVDKTASFAEYVIAGAAKVSKKPTADLVMSTSVNDGQLEHAGQPEAGKSATPIVTEVSNTAPKAPDEPSRSDPLLRADQVWLATLSPGLQRIMSRTQAAENYARIKSLGWITGEEATVSEPKTSRASSHNKVFSGS